MAAVKKRVKAEQIAAQLKYWRDVRMDSPDRKAEALRHIDKLLDEFLAEKDSADGS